MFLWGADRVFDFLEKRTKVEEKARSLQKIRLILGICYFGVGLVIIIAALLLSGSSTSSTAAPSVSVDSSTLLAAGTLLLVVVTGFYAWQTRRTVNVLERTASLEFLPFLKGSIEFIGPVNVIFQVTNVGRGTASRIRLEYWIRERPETTRRTWTKDFLTVGDSQRFFIPVDEQNEELSIGVFKSTQTTIEMRGHYFDSLGKEHVSSDSIDITAYLKQYDKSHAEYSEKWYDKAASGVNALSRDVGNLSSEVKDIARGVENLDRNSRISYQLSTATDAVNSLKIDEDKKNEIKSKIAFLGVLLREEFLFPEDQLSMAFNEIETIDKSAAELVFKIVIPLQHRVKREQKKEADSPTGDKKPSA